MFSLSAQEAPTANIGVVSVIEALLHEQNFD
jgi:hypothetical protein